MTTNGPLQTFWITKCALRFGCIVSVPGRWMSGGGIVTCNPPDLAERFFPSEFHESREVAVAHAEQLRLAEIARLESEIARLKAMTFDTVREG